MDACEEVAKEAAAGGARYSGPANDDGPPARDAGPGAKDARAGAPKIDNLDGFIENDEDDEEANYADDD